MGNDWKRWLWWISHVVISKAGLDYVRLCPRNHRFLLFLSPATSPCRGYRDISFRFICATQDAKNVRCSAVNRNQNERVMIRIYGESLLERFVLGACDIGWRKCGWIRSLIILIVIYMIRSSHIYSRSETFYSILIARGISGLEIFGLSVAVWILKEKH